MAGFAVLKRQGWQKVIFAGGVMESGEINGHPALQEAYQAGKQV